jgi:antitoxin HicB
MSKKSHIGSSFNDYLEEEGNADEINAIAIKRVLAWQIQQAMDNALMSKNQMAKAMHTSRSQLDRILDPENLSIQLDTVFKAANVLGRKVRIELE